MKSISIHLNPKFLSYEIIVIGNFNNSQINSTKQMNFLVVIQDVPSRNPSIYNINAVVMLKYKDGC